MQCYDNKNAFNGFILNVFIINKLRSYLIRLRSFRSYFTRVRQLLPLLTQEIELINMH
jgi:hypothetical protein